MAFALLILFSLLAGLGALAVAALFLAVPERTRARVIPLLLSYATGTLLAAATLGLLPQALRHRPAADIMASLLGGIVFFFVLHKLVLWRHCHEANCEEHGAAGSLILIGDSLHNVADGIILAVAFHTSVPLGISTAFAVIAHEIPQELGDFAILLHSGYSRRRAFVWNAVSSLASIAGALGAYLLLEQAMNLAPYLMAVAAANFLYVAIGDLIPALHRRSTKRGALLQIALVAAGIGTIVLMHGSHAE